MVELRPLGVRCNIQCHYCYQNPQRDAGNFNNQYDLERMKDAIMLEGGPFAMFGGEPLLVGESDLEELWSWGFEQFGYNAVQSNGTLINDEHIRMFKAYKVSVGISLDGPDELNDVRWHGTLEKTREATACSQRAIERLCAEGIPPSLIVTLHRANAAPELLPRLCEWIKELDAMGVQSVRLHLLESENESIRFKYALSTAENIAALLTFAELEKNLTRLTFDLFSDMRQMLTGDDQLTSCVWNACDSYTTSAVRGVEGHGERSNCGRTNKDGIDFVKARTAGFERYIALYHTPQPAGGCSGCRFFLMCKGQCPGTAINGEWRNRSEHCEVWKAIYEYLESELLNSGLKPVSLSSQREQLEQVLINAWAQGNTGSVFEAMRQISNDGPPANATAVAWPTRLKQLSGVLEEALS